MLPWHATNLSQNNSQLFCSAQCHVPKFFVHGNLADFTSFLILLSMSPWHATNLSQSFAKNFIQMVGMTGFEPAAPTSRTWCATKLRYIPNTTCFPNYYFGKVLYLSRSMILNDFFQHSIISRISRII